MNNQCLIKIGDRKYISDNPYIAVSDELIKWCKNKSIYDDVIVRLNIGGQYKNVYAQYIHEDDCFEFLQVWWGGESEVEIFDCCALQGNLYQTINLSFNEVDKRRKEIERRLRNVTYGMVYTANKESIFTDILDADLTVGDCVEFSGEISENGIHNAILLEKYEAFRGRFLKFVSYSDDTFLAPLYKQYRTYVYKSETEIILHEDVEHKVSGRIIEIHLSEDDKGRIFVRKLK